MDKGVKIVTKAVFLSLIKPAKVIKKKMQKVNRLKWLSLTKVIASEDTSSKASKSLRRSKRLVHLAV